MVGITFGFMSVSVEIFKIPEPAEKEVPVIGLRDCRDIPFLDEEFLQDSLDLNDWVTGGRRATFYAKVKGNTKGSIFREGDVLVVDRSWPIQNNKLAVCCIGEEFVLKKIRSGEEGLWLESINGYEDPVWITEENQFLIWGLVTYEVKRIW